MHIQKHDTFRNWDIFRTLSKNSYLMHILIFREMSVSSLSELEKLKEPTLKKILIFREMDLSSSRLKKLLMFQENTCNIWKIKNFLYFISNINVNVSYKEAKCSKLKYFLIIIIKCFSSFYNIFFYTQVYFFHFVRDFCDVCDHIVAFYLSFL